MDMRHMKTRNPRGLNSLVLSVIMYILVFTVVVMGLSGASDGVTDEGVRVAEEAIVRGAVSCYAIEGRYPESYEYLRDNYGVAVNEDKYIIHYSAFASNIMPDIMVIAKDGVK